MAKLEKSSTDQTLIQELDYSLNMKREHRFLVMVLIFFAMSLLTAFIMTLLGVLDIRILNNIEFSPALSNLINMALFLFNMFFVFSITLRIFDKRIIAVIIGFVPVYFLMIMPTSIFENFGSIITAIVPFIYCLIVGKVLKISLRKISIHYSILTILTSAFQLLMSFIKIWHGFNLQHIVANTMTYVIMHIDLMLYYIILYMVVKNHVLALARELVVFPKNLSIQIPVKDDKENLDLSHHTKRQAFIFWILVALYQVFQLVVVISIGILNNVLIELCIMLAVFWFGRTLLKHSWHGESLLKCSIATFIGFYLITKITIPLYLSLFFCIALASVFTYFLYRIGVYQVEYETLYAEYCYIHNPIEHCTLDQFVYKCKYSGIKDVDIDFAVDSIFNKLDTKELMCKYHYTESGVKMKKKRIKDKLK